MESTWTAGHFKRFWLFRHSLKKEQITYPCIHNIADLVCKMADDFRIRRIINI